MSLTEISYYARRAAPFAVVFVLIILIIFYAFKIFFLYLDTKKTATLTTKPIFGVLKYPKVQDAAIPSGKIDYSLDTIEGRPIIATSSAQVFFLPKQTTQFGYREKVTLMAQSFGIDTDLTKYNLVDQGAKFADGKNTLTIDISSFNFEYQYALDQDPTIFDDINIPDSSKVEESARQFIQSLGKYPEDLAQGKINIVYLHYDPTSTQLNVVDSPAQANLVEADFYRPDIGEYPIVSPKYFNSQNFVVMVFHTSDQKVVKAQIKHYDVSQEQIGIYPLKTGEEAYQQLIAGKALYISLPQSSNVVIKKMFLGYLDPDIYQEYLQPVYVFLGENNFVAYVPAVTDQYLSPK